MTQPQRMGKYTLRRHLATGGMAEIWLAEQEGPGGFAKELVIKRILSHFSQDTQFTTMFLDEARLVAQLSHPKIAQIYELGDIDGHYFIAMEYIEGIDVDELLQLAISQDGALPIDVVCKIMLDVLEALDYAHAYTDRDGTPFNLVHRDVSPHNVLISNDGIVKLCDFGVAKAKANQTKTQPGAVKGKFAYMAPEQIQSQELDQRADIFAAGVMFYELLTGVKPFGDELAAVSGIVSRPHDDPRTHRPDIPEEIAAVIDRALQKDREQRYSDAHEMALGIQNYLRTAAIFVGDRELSSYVRGLQGLPTTRHSQPAVKGPSTGPTPAPEVDTASTTDQLYGTSTHSPGREPRRTEPERPGTTPSDVSPEPRKTAAELAAETESAEMGLQDTGRLESVAPATAPTTGPIDAEPRKSGVGGLVAVFGIVIALIVVCGLVIGYIVLSDKGAQTKEPQPKHVAQVEGPKTNRQLLEHKDGRLVQISTRPQNMEIWLDGQKVEDTPFMTTLRPGDYKVQFRHEDRQFDRTITVEPGTKRQRIVVEIE